MTRILGVFPLSNTWRRVFQVTTVRLVGLSRAVDAGALPCQLPKYLIRWGRPFQIRPTEHGTFQNDDYEYSEHHQRLGTRYARIVDFSQMPSVFIKRDDQLKNGRSKKNRIFGVPSPSPSLC